MDSRGKHRFVHVETIVHQVDQDLGDGGADSVGAARSEGDFGSVFLEEKGGGHHGGKTCVGRPTVEAAGAEVFFSQHVVEHDAAFPKNMSASLPVGKAHRGEV